MLNVKTLLTIVLQMELVVQLFQHALHIRPNLFVQLLQQLKMELEDMVGMSQKINAEVEFAVIRIAQPMTNAILSYQDIKQMDLVVWLEPHVLNFPINNSVLNQILDHVFGLIDNAMIMIDMKMLTYTECQAFSPLFSTNGDTCIPITSCASTSLKASCVVGTDGACGWLLTGKCQKFGQCTDAVATTNDECLSYGPACITDGTAFLAKSTCISYKTQTACNNNGTDGICFWNATANTCKLRECGNEQKGKNDQCKLISITGGSCTTDGTKCIPLSICSNYVEAGFFNGTDGECTFALPVGATTGNKICRLTQCEDIYAGTSNANCMEVISGKQCISNGISCIAKSACSSYKTITAFNGDGLENNKSIFIAFAPTGTDKVN
ncbi:unnamed protein product [Paramecium primaurelia]|uniref:Antifreeze protein n=1 Tax=Paramecium primaurelia TaxID=5886 RepID=A0A8S1JY02_PARPR|nr:unnamed protein product [Paramecium primaurelia]